MDDPYQLERFVAAQDSHGTYQRAVAELRAGAKRGHWMWFIFPQIAGLGFSAMSKRYAISSLAEARAYSQHPVLGPRLEVCTRIVAGTEGKTATDIFGSVDAMKLRSSMTLFAAATDLPAFRTVLTKYFDSEPDEATLERLELPDQLARREIGSPQLWPLSRFSAARTTENRDKGPANRARGLPMAPHTTSDASGTRTCALSAGRA